MKTIQRDFYLQELIKRKENGMIKVITGIRRCGKSYLLFEIYRNYLLSIGVKDARPRCRSKCAVQRPDETVGIRHFQSRR